MTQLLENVEILVDKIANSIKPISNKLDFDYTTSKDDTTMPSFLKIGNLISKHGTVYPALLPTKDIKGLAFKINDSNREEIHFALQHYALQLIKGSSEGHVNLTVIDTKKMGSNFRLLRKLNKQILPHFVADEDAQRSAIDEQFNKSVSVISECLTHYDSLAEYNQKAGHVQPFRIVLIADFPNGFRENLDKVNALLTNADEAGVFVFLTYDPDFVTRSNEEKVNRVLGQCYHLEEYGDPVNDFYNIKKEGNAYTVFDNYTLQLDRKDINAENLAKEIAALTKEENVVEQDQIDGIEIPIGKTLGQTFHFTFGYKSDNFHAIIGGQSGKGKTVLLNNIIAKGIASYSPDELRFVLIDCGGTGFHEFDNALHMQLMCRSSNVETCHVAVQFIEQEMIRREELFKNAGVADLKQYVKKTGKPLPRLFCIIDEFHVLYTGREKFSSYFDTVLVDRVIRIGRKFGLHLIVCTQSLGGGVRRSILDNIPLRIALGMTTDQSQGFLGMRNDAANNLERGKAVYNGQNGDARSNKIIQVNYINDEDIQNIIDVSVAQNPSFEHFERTIN
jgi:DNA segregation ATPase FtsK/SpoIIIE, S-DNA-T family